jgi:digeranylgeranylglycerophospholipid reductase
MVAEYRPVIIGGSVIGNYLAYRLTERGLKPIVIEEHPKIGEPVQCTGLVSKRIFDLEKLPKRLFKNKIDRLIVHFPDDSVVEVKGEAHLLDRAALDLYFYEKAKEGGADYLLGEKVIKLVTVDYVYAKTTKRKFKTDLVVGADGPLSMVRTHFGLFYKMVPAVQALAGYNTEPGETHVYMGSQHTDYQFAWAVPESTKTARIGMFVTEDTHGRLNRFMESLGAKAMEVQAGIVPIDYPKQSAFAHALLVGDAACQTKASTGGGIVTGMICADVAADAIAKAYEKEDFSEGFLLKNYDVPWRRKIIKELKTAYISRKALNRLSDGDLNRVGELARKHRDKIEKFGDIDFYSDMYKAFRGENDFRWFALRKVLRYPGLLLDLF